MKFKRIAALLLVIVMTATNALATAAYTKFDFIMDLLQNYGLDEENTDVLREYMNKRIAENPEEFDAIVNDILQSHDSHSMYLSPEEYPKAFSTLQGDYVGIGVSYTKSLTGHKVTGVFEGGPADLAGLREGDIIVAIDGKNIGSLTTDGVKKLMLGGTGTSIDITYRRNGVNKTVSTHRKQVTIDHVSNKTISNGVEYIKVEAMGNQEDSDKFKKIWNSLPAKKTSAVILDLRNNGGGMISMALDMLNTMIPDKDQTYMGLRNRKDQGGFQLYTSEGLSFRLNKIIILVNDQTASAAEMVSGSMSDLGYANLVGVKTYGKGVGQAHIPLIDGSVVVVTTLEMFLPKRLNYEGVGIQPDIHMTNKQIPFNMPSLNKLNTKTNLYKGTASDDVYAVTQRLKVLGYLPYADKYFSQTVLDAVNQFQRENNLSVVNYCGTQTLNALEKNISLLAKSTTTEDIQFKTAVAMAELAAKKPVQYTVDEKGKWTNVVNANTQKNETVNK